MGRIKGVAARVRTFLRRGVVERELDEEIRFHLEMEIAKNVRAGLDHESARRKAIMAFGGVERTKEALRDGHGGRWLDDVVRDARYALRTLRLNPGFSAAAVLTLALGIAANSAVFSVVDGVVFRALPYPEPDELTMVWLNNPAQGFERDITSYPVFADWREQSRSFEEMVAVDGSRMNLTGDGEPVEISVGMVTEGYFRLLGVEPAIGRSFTAEEQASGGPRAVVLSHAFWTARFGGDPAVLDRPIRLNGEPYAVVGVMPPDRGYPAGADLWTPLENQAFFADLREARGALWLPVVGRLADGVSIEAAQEEMTAIARGLAEAYPSDNGAGVLLEPLHDTVVGDVRAALVILLAAVGLVLLIACANISSLLLARGIARRRELAVRVALGADRRRLIRQILTESAVLAAAGAVVGLVLTVVAVDLLIAAAPAEVPRIANVMVDGRVVAFTLVVSALAALLFGLAPAIDVARREAGPLLKAGGRSASGAIGRTRPVLVAGQIMLSLVLLVGAGLLIRSFAELQSVDPRFEPEGVLSVGLNLSADRYPDAAAIRGFYARLMPSIEALPAVESAAVVSDWFLSELPQSASVSIQGRPDLSDADRNFPVAYDAISPGLFRTLGVRLVRGRDVAETDGPDDPAVAVVNEAFARRFFPDADALGGRFAFGTPQDDDGWITIVGIVADARRSGLDADVRPAAFLPATAYVRRGMELMVRTSGDPRALAGAVRGSIRDIDRNQPIAAMRTLEQQIADSVAQRRFTMYLLAIFAAAALVLAAIGLYGVMAHAVAQRTHEIGIRIALGARAADVSRLIVGQAMRVALAGLLLGLVASMLLGRLLQQMLYGIDATDPATFVAAALVLSAVAMMASLLPTLRATRVHPIVALKAE